MVKRSIFLLFGLLLMGQKVSNAQEVVFKLKAEINTTAKSKLQNSTSLKQTLSEMQLIAKPLFPNHAPLQKSALAEGKIDISGIYRIRTNTQQKAESLIKKLKKHPQLEYVELMPINQLVYQPSDTAIYRQWYLNSVRAFEAWDVEQGDTSVFIAIIDTGTDTDHEDLTENLYKNYNDPINGIDDDNDGYIDNYYGWDVVNNSGDVNPIDFQHPGFSHGTNVLGIAGAVTDNVTGIAGAGFNTRIMTIKADGPSGSVAGAYQGVVYAADQGAPIINCSWGSYNFSQFAQDIINYAAINRGALVICGAGNGPFSGQNTGVGVEDRFYPAAYDNAMAIGSLLETDTVKLSSNYGYWMDLFAPGEAMWTTTSLGGYGITGGTSMAAPVVAAAAALVKAQNPSFTAKQIEERLINSAVSIDAQNEGKYLGKVGAGKVDFLNALEIDSLAGIRMENIRFSNGSSENIFPADSLFISGDFTNYLQSSSALNLQLEILDSGAQVIKGQINLPAIASQNTIDNRQDPFIFKVDPELIGNQRLVFRLTISSTNYQKVQHFSTLVNQNYLTMDNGELSVTVSSDGGVGYTGPSNSLGDGVRFRGGNSLLYEGGLMIGNSATYLVDKFRGTTGTDTDFYPLSLVREVSYAQAESATATLFDDGYFSSPARIQIEQTNYFYDSTYTENALLINYHIKNISNSALNGIYVGLIADWDLIDYTRNRVFYDENRKMGLSSSLDSSLFAGLMAISHPSLANHYAIDNQEMGAGGVDLSDGFDGAEKLTVLMGGRDNAGFHRTEGADVLDAISMGPFNISRDSSLNLTFAILVANDLSALQEASDSAKSIYENFPIGIAEGKKAGFQFSIYPNPAENQLNLLLQSKQKTERFDIEILDLQGRMMIRKMSENGPLVKLDIQSLKNGVYLIRIKGENRIFQDKFAVSN